MTRDQALRLALCATESSHIAGDHIPLPLSSHAALLELLKILEAVGLIKFDADDRAEGKRFVKQMAPTWENLRHNDLGKAIIEDIEKMGLKIVRA